MAAYLNGEMVVVLDCADLDRAAGFWTAVLGYLRAGLAHDRYLSLISVGAAGPELLLQQVPEHKHGKNRLHLDLRTRDLDAEVDRVQQAGATRLTEQPIEESGWRWHVLADPDGNEFCVLQPPTTHWDRRRTPYGGP
jgi:predicted enzyme related to lactoylglutathione lyase